VLQTLDDLRQRTALPFLKLIANLPYAVATPVISNFLLTELPFERMVVTVQWEIAERLLAAPGNKDYGALAVLVQSVADVSLVRKLAPSVFWPRPEVESAIVLIRPNAEKRAHVGDVHRFRVFLRDLYAHRRKNLRGGLVSLAGREFSKEHVDGKLAELALDGRARAETLDVEQHLRLCAVFGG
jgi:16S rRNA (adenine1518-N6/adenine1519-N6)-dimethyltransferase